MVKWSIGTYARMRPPRRGHDCAKFLLEKIGDGKDQATAIVFPPPDEDEDRMQLKQRDELEFRFSDIFDPGVSQEQVFNDVCLDIVHSALNGYNGTILAYGQTGSGKTYTITGGEHYADRGIIPRVLSTIFEEFEQRAHMRYSCYISYLEIYNESVYDLLDRSHTDRPIEEWTKVLLMDDEDGDMHFRNLGVYEAVSEEEALNLLFLGNMNRVTSDTPMNQASSRSHSIFSVMIEARPPDSDMIVTSKLHLVDLAGSERVYKREGTQRMRSEGKHINLSLHHLEQVILSLRTKRNSVAKGYHVPYRNSMLTSVLRGSLGGNCKSVFIATLNPESEFLDESISTCRFMQRCSEVTVDVAVNAEVDTEKRLDTLEKANTQLEATNFNLQARVVQLENELKAQELLLSKQEQNWQLRLAHIQREADAAVDAAKIAASKPDSPADWIQCEVLVEKLTRAGNLPREKLSIRTKDDGTTSASSEKLFTSSADNDELVRRGLDVFHGVTKEIREQGMEVALGCLAVMMERSHAASVATTNMQDAARKHQAVVDHLEKRLQEHHVEAERLRAQMQRTAWSNGPNRSRNESGSSSSYHYEEQDAVTSIPRSKSHSGASTGVSDSQQNGRLRPSSIRNRSFSRASSNADDDSRRSRGGAIGTESDSELDDDSEAHSDSHSSFTGRNMRASSSSSYRHRPTVTFESDGRDNDLDSRRSSKKKQDAARQPSLAAIRNPSSSNASDLSAPTVMMKLLQSQNGVNDRVGSDVVRKRLELLQNGSLFVKYGRYGKPHVRFVWCSADLENLHYRTIRSSTPKASIATRTISRVLVGQATRVFERAKQDARAPFCFSIEYEDARTLDLEVADGGELSEFKMAKRGEWVEALQLLVKLKHAATISALTAGVAFAEPESSGIRTNVE